VARLATVSAGGQPHLVPVTFGVVGDVVFSAVDHKPKRTLALKRLANVAGNPRVTLLVDEYSDDWSVLWWARADGLASVVEPGEPDHAHAVEALVARYEQYRDRPPEGPALVVDVERWSGWAAG
jgi:PPOX class probable F420-dependent enzyme